MEKSDESPRVRKLRELVTKYGDHNGFARKFDGVSASYVYQVLGGRRNFGEKAARNMAEKIGKPADFFEGSSSLDDLQRLLVKAADGLNDEQLSDLIAAARAMKRGKVIEIRDPPQATTASHAKDG